MTNKVYLSDEVRKLQAYLKERTEEFRYRMNSCVFCDLEDIDGLVIISDVLEPVCENIFKHAMIDIWEDGYAIVQVERSEERVTISIEDNGTGIPEEELETLRKDMREGTAESPEHSMAGIRYRLHEAYGPSGDIVIESLSGFGTTIVITIPAERE